MTITRDNYEPYFLDFLEGNLKEDQIDQFLDFLELNPDLKEELQLLENMTLPEEQIDFSGKEHLYKTSADFKAATETKMIASLEGDLESNEKKLFESQLEGHPELKSEYELFSKTILSPDPSVKFPNKKSLYRKSGNRIILTLAARAAAVIILLWGINSLFQSQNDQPVQERSKEVATNTPTRKIEKQSEPEKVISDLKIQDKIKPEEPSAPFKTPKVIKGTVVQPEEKAIVENLTERNLVAMSEIIPRKAQLEPVQTDNQLAFSRAVNVNKINEQKNVMTIDEFLAVKAKKVGNEGLLSANRIIRTGLGIASELSGERLGYREKDGKITSLDFESKLMAFSIPLKKEQ
jgi:hypothetical protein